MKWTRFSVVCPPEAVEAVVGIMMEVTGAGPAVEAVGDLNLVSCYVPAGLETEGLGLDLQIRLRRIPSELCDARLELTSAVVEDEDWAHAWKAFYRPLRVGRRLVIKPSWESWPPAENPHASRPDDIVIELDPQMAFGTGNHASTQLCLCALEDLVRPGQAVLDIGCGSGILSLAAAKLGAASVLAVDIDPLSVETATANVLRAGLAPVITVRQGSIEIVGPHRFDLAVANINAPVVNEMAREVAQVLVPGGWYIASGLTESMVEGTRQAMAEAGLGQLTVRAQEGWACVLGRAAE